MDDALKNGLDELVEKTLNLVLNDKKYSKIIVTDRGYEVNPENRRYTHNIFLNRQPVINGEVVVKINYPCSEYSGAMILIDIKNILH